MLASRVTFSNETKIALQNPILDKKKKRDLRRERVKTFIRQYPSGELINLEDLVYAAGWDVKDKVQYQSGWYFIQRMIRDKILEKVDVPGKKAKEWYIVDDETVNQISEPTKKQEQPESGDEPKIVMYEKLEYQTLDVEFVRRIESLARDFSWNNDSDSLREFIKSLK